MRVVRLGFLTLVAVSVVMIGVRVALYLPVLVQPGGSLSVLAPVGVLLVYGLLGGWITAHPPRDHAAALRTGTACGVVSGLVSVAHMAQEAYVPLPPRELAIVTWVFILAMFAPWAFAGFAAARRTRHVPLGLLAAVWSSAVCMVLTVSFGFGQLLTSLDRLQRHDVGSPDFLRSGWTDLRAFAIADIFEAGFWHLVIGPIVALLLGGIAATAASCPSWYKTRLAKAGEMHKTTLALLIGLAFAGAHTFGGDLRVEEVEFASHGVTLSGSIVFPEHQPIHAASGIHPRIRTADEKHALGGALREGRYRGAGL